MVSVEGIDTFTGPGPSRRNHTKHGNAPSTPLTRIFAISALFAEGFGVGETWDGVSLISGYQPGTPLLAFLLKHIRDARSDVRHFRHSPSGTADSLPTLAGTHLPKSARFQGICRKCRRRKRNSGLVPEQGAGRGVKQVSEGVTGGTLAILTSGTIQMTRKYPGTVTVA
jgi:hypothetical protein